MYRLWMTIVLTLLILMLPASAQEGLNLPTELYILRNDGEVERYGLGTSGVQTITPEGTFVLDFGIAPDANWFAYRTQEGLYLDHMHLPDQGIQLEGETAGVPPIRGGGETLVWSPGGDALVYTTLSGARVYFNTGEFFDIETTELQHLSWSPEGNFLAAEADNNIWWIYRREGTSLTLTSAIPSSVGTAWLNDHQIAFAPADGGLLLMDLIDRNLQTPILNASRSYSLPFLVSDNILQVFGSSSNQETDFGRLVRVTLDESGGQVEEVGENDALLENVRWSPDGQLLVAFQGGVLALIDPITGQGFTLPITSTATYLWGSLRPFAVDGLSLPTEAYFLARDPSGILQVWKLPGDASIPAPITLADEDIRQYAIAPDGRGVAYLSGQSLWYDHPNVEETPTILADVDGEIETLMFSRDGRTLAYATSGNSDASPGGIWLAAIDSDAPELVLKNGPGENGPAGAPPFYSNPQFAPNINALLLTVRGSETTNLTVLDLNTEELIPVGAFDGGFWLRDGRVIAYGTGIGLGDPMPSEIVVLDVNTQAQPIPLFTVPANVRIDSLQETNAGLLRLLTSPGLMGPVPITVVHVPLNGEAERLFDLQNIVEPQFSRDGTTVAGYTHPGGALIFHDVEDNSRSILNTPAAVWDFRWR